MLNLLEVEKSCEEVPRREREIKRIIEALLFASNEALSLEKMRDVISSAYPVGRALLRRLIEELAEEYRKREHAFQIDLIGGGYVLRTVEEMGVFVELLNLNRRGEKLSKAAMEVLAIIAYRSPITRSEIEAIRGVDSSGTVSSLVERGLIEEVGRKEAPGRPIQWGVTKRFLHHFGLKELDDLKKLTF